MTQKTQKGQDTSVTDEIVEKELSYEIVGAFYTVYNALGYGFLESVYANALSLELQMRNLKVQREVPIDVLYKGQCVGRYRMDMLVEGRVLIETKASAAVGEPENRQLFNYLRASRMPIALLLHFGPKPWYKRLVWTGKQLNS
jgi:GxxExxY protein